MGVLSCIEQVGRLALGTCFSASYEKESSARCGGRSGQKRMGVVLTRTSW